MQSRILPYAKHFVATWKPRKYSGEVLTSGLLRPLCIAQMLFNFWFQETVCSNTKIHDACNILGILAVSCLLWHVSCTYVQMIKHLSCIILEIKQKKNADTFADVIEIFSQIIVECVVVGWAWIDCAFFGVDLRLICCPIFRTSWPCCFYFNTYIRLFSVRCLMSPSTPSTTSR